MRAIATFIVAVFLVLFLSLAPASQGRQPGRDFRSEEGRTTLVIIFKDGHQQSFSLAEIARIEFRGNAESNTPTVRPVDSNWTGRFVGVDTSGYPIEISLTEQNGGVGGGYSYYHKAQRKQVRAIIVDTRIEGDTLRGRWKQVEGIISEGGFVWRWLAGQRGKAFEGTFDGVRYWTRMTRR